MVGLTPAIDQFAVADSVDLFQHIATIHAIGIRVEL